MSDNALDSAALARLRELVNHRQTPGHTTWKDSELHVMIYYLPALLDLAQRGLECERELPPGAREIVKARDELQAQVIKQQFERRQHTSNAQAMDALTQAERWELYKLNDNYLSALEIDNHEHDAHSAEMLADYELMLNTWLHAHGVIVPDTDASGRERGGTQEEHGSTEK